MRIGEMRIGGSIPEVRREMRVLERRGEREERGGSICGSIRFRLGAGE